MGGRQRSARPQIQSHKVGLLPRRGVVGSGTCLAGRTPATASGEREGLGVVLFRVLPVSPHRLCSWQWPRSSLRVLVLWLAHRIRLHLSCNYKKYFQILNESQRTLLFFLLLPQYHHSLFGLSVAPVTTTLSLPEMFYVPLCLRAFVLL